MPQRVDTSLDFDVWMSGPSLEEGPMPAIFYFAVTGEESLGLDPFDQPVRFLADQKVRFFSFTLPGHGQELKNAEAMQYWAEQLDQQRDFVTPFVNQAKQALDALQPHITKVASAGLSRGAFAATHFAANDERVSVVLGFAPLTALLHDSPFARQFDLTHLVDRLTHRKIRFYIGNLDTRVNTDTCYTFIRQLALAAQKEGVRSPTAELVIYPSIGHKGHGTPPEIFQSGVNWIKTLWELT